MLEQDVFVLADRTLNGVVSQIRDDQWPMEMPPDFPTTQTGKTLTLREVINYHAYDEVWVPDMLAGRTMDEVGKDKHQGDLLGADPKATFAELVDTACAAVEALDDPSRTVHCSFGDFTAREYLQQILCFRGFRAHDIAKVIGTDTRLPAALVEGMAAIIEPVADEWRQYGVFGPRVEVPADASPQDKLLGLTGRQPD